MKISTRSLLFNKALLFCVCLFLMQTDAKAQLPMCTPNQTLVYLQVGSSIYNFDATQPIVVGVNPVLNTIGAPAGGWGGLAVGPNLNAAGPSPTFYTTVGGIYYYHNGTTWVNTGHNSGNTAAVNLGAGTGAIYNLVGGSGQVYVYNGTANGTLLTTVAGFNGGGPYDLCCDCAGNFYILNTSAPNQWLRKYDPAGNLLQQWTLVGAPSTTAGGGLGIIGNTVWYHNNTPNWITATLGATTLTVTNIGPGLGTYSPADVASCPLGGVALHEKDTAYYCGYGPGTTLTSPGAGPFTWQVLNGPAVITGNGASVTVTSASNSLILHTYAGNQLCNTSATSTDTFQIIVPTGTVNAGPATDTIKGCGVYEKVLSGSMFNTTPWITYSIAWTPTASISSGATSLTPTINPTANTQYVVSLSTPANRGGCVWTDTILAVVQDVSVTADYNFNVRWGCQEDTVDFTNTSSANSTTYNWDFADANGDVVANPTHIYQNQNIYNVKLIVSNATCKDSITKPIDINHPLEASFTVDDDSVCEGQIVNFTNTSVTTTINSINPTFFWDFKDGGISNLQSPTHQFALTGTYNVMMIVTDFVPCQDTAYHIVLVDSIPHAYISISDSVLCAGQPVHFSVDYLDIGNTGTKWEFGDGTVILDRGDISHAYDGSGIYNVKFTASYRICNDTFDTQTIEVRTFPAVDLGPDTALCPNAGIIRLADRITPNISDPSIQYKWNTGATNVHTILADTPGTYYLTAMLNGCSTTDSVTILHDCYINVPNTFTPNGDGMNDYFFPRQLLSKSLTHFDMKIFNRWGQIIFQSSNINGRGWDGTFNDQNQPTGVYVYMIEANFTNGRTETYKGNVTLLR